jgi:hypothetical protein
MFVPFSSQHGFPSSDVVVFLCSVIWGKRWLFVLLILMAFFTITAFIAIISVFYPFFFRKCTDDRFKTWKLTSFVIFCYCYRWYKVTSLLVFRDHVFSYVSKVNYHVHAVFLTSIKTPTRRVAPYTPTRSCVHIDVLKTKIRSKKNRINKE